MQKIILLFLVAFSSICLNAQTNLDSFYIVRQDKTQPDSNRTKALDDYIWFGYVHSQPDSMLVLSNTLFEFSREQGIKNVMANALNMMGQERKDVIAAQELKQKKLERNGFMAGFVVGVAVLGIL